MSVSDIVWLAALVLFLIAEASTISLVSIWFAAGALAALITSWLGGPVSLQIIVFFGISGILLACLRPLVRKYFKPRITRTNAEGLIGTEGILTADVNNLQQIGSVQLNGLEWTARSSDDSPIPAGTRVRVDRIEGVRAYVSPVSTATFTR